MDLRYKIVHEMPAGRNMACSSRTYILIPAFPRGFLIVKLRKYHEIDLICLELKLNFIHVVYMWKVTFGNPVLLFCVLVL